ncbi:DHA1 family inner membrane transport protein [Zymomonas mobilis]|uniref:DHA1 family inner membrane transport protein n=1 Tax=Zymomonas mobilis TaxID=542 RepID=A0A542W2R2_ZYMMB|nr:MFS transporter [Zymomonas mobilis]TQL17779.1 DHA1 family inner membrane transport protein [Zymomonas mobilis]
MPIALLALAIGAFGLGTTETIVMGILPELSHDLHVSIAKAGLLVSGYAIGVTIASPLMAIMTNRYSRRQTLLFMMAIFVLGNICSALAPDYQLLMASRVLTSLSHGTFYGAASIVACQIVPPQKRAEALSIVYIGLTLAMVLGVPLGTLVAQFTSWRVSFWLISAVGSLAWISIWCLIPQDVQTANAPRLYDQFRSLTHPMVIIMMLVSMCTAAGMFGIFTYITPFLEIRTALSAHATDLVLLLIGAGLCLGNLLGGRLADWKMLPSCGGLLGIAIIIQLLLVPASLHVWSAALLFFLWGIFIYAPMAPLQSYVVTCAEAAPNIAAAVNQSAFNLGNAIGSWAGSLIIGASAAYSYLPLLSSYFVAIGVILVCLAGYLQSRENKKKLNNP